MTEAAPPLEVIGAGERALGATGPLRRYTFIAGFVVAAAVTAIAVFLTAATPASQPADRTSQLVLVALSLNMLLILVLAAASGWRALQIFAPRVEDAGVRLHRRFVGLFALAAVAPAIIVALFFGLLVTRGVENWFSSRVRTVVENAATVARSYVNEQERVVGESVGRMAKDLNRPDVAPLLQTKRLLYSVLLAQAVERDFSAVYVIDDTGRILARAEAPGAAPFLAPPPATLAMAQRHNEVEMETFRANDLVRAVYRLSAYPNAFLYVARPVDEGIVGQLRRSEQAVIAYREAEKGRARIQAIFALSYISTALLVLVGAVWVGMAAAGQIAGPVARLVLAADRVAGGDLSARVPADKDPEEIAVLSRAFNRMTSDLQAQQSALRDASLDAQARRRFIEAVLSGVSAGVVGLDSAGCISAVNEGALAHLHVTESAVMGRPLAEVAPELEPVVRRAMQSGQDSEAEVDILRDADTRRLRVRASGRVDGLVLTFDDITRLVAAQRNAAWRDVARRIAHEIKNPLTPIQLSAERLRRKYRGEITGDLETFDRCTDTIIRQVGDIGRMVDEFSSFARMPAPKFEAEDAAELLRQAVFAQRVAYPDILVEMEEPSAAPGFVCDERMVAQALLNVLKNAGEAVAARMALEPGRAGRIGARLEADTTAVRFIVEDNGVGLPSRDRDRLTEPYVTTREKGTGLGLAIVKRILEEHGGELSLADAEKLDGARVILRFPGLGRSVTSAA